MKPMKFTPVTNFYEKRIESKTINSNRNPCDGLGEDEDEENKEHEEELEEKGKEEMKNKMLCKIVNKNVKHNKKERNAKRECSECESMNNTLKHDITKFKEHEV